MTTSHRRFTAPGRLVAALAAAIMVAACQGGPAATDPTAQEGSVSTSPKATGFTNPVYAMNFPDPQVLPDGKGGWVAIATNGNGMNVQTITSPDLVTWTQGVDALPQVASWSSTGKVWAPEIVAWPSGGYRMFYTTRSPDPEVQCLSVASSDVVAGPYTDVSSAPIICEPSEGGSIDASPFIDDDGKAYLYWKNDGNAINADTWMKVQSLSPDGLSVTGNLTQLFKQDQPWEGPLVEGPAVVKVDDVYHLFYSGNGFWTDQYGVGHATATSPLGPFVKDPEPLLKSNEVAAGPGHNQLFQMGDQWWTVYHAWEPGAVGDDSVGRQMWLGRVTFDGKKATIEEPTVDMPVLPGS